jgi:arginyl-tRNA synthetase
MHVGHIRSTVIGDALCRVLRFLGHNVVSDNHIGDWGTQFGMILYGYKDKQLLNAEAYRRNPVEELARLYRLVRRLMDEEESSRHTPCADTAHGVCGVQAAVLAETAKLHAGDAENRRLWAEFLPFCEDEIARVYRRLGVSFDHSLGESFYEDRLAAVVEDLLQRDIARESEGAICVFLEGHKTPMIVRKRDGAFLYGTTDLATIQYRVETWRPDEILYVVDHRQSLHFQQLFAAARLLGYKGVELHHVSFGTVLGNDGRPFKTRSGDTVGLEGLLDEAVRRAFEIVSANDDAKPDGPELSDPQRRQIAEHVGIAALKYADLSQNRTSDYVFSYDKMLAMTGNTATYMQYAYARVRSIFARGGVDVDRLRTSGAAILLGSPAERALGLEILRFSEALELTVADYRPNQLTSYLFDLANRYSTFFEQCHVLRAENDELRQSRLLLCDLTARTIQKGLELLGITVVEKM